MFLLCFCLLGSTGSGFGHTVVAALKLRGVHHIGSTMGYWRESDGYKLQVGSHGLVGEVGALITIKVTQYFHTKLKKFVMVILARSDL